MPRSVVVDPAVDWQDDRPPARKLHDTPIYEVHVKGFTSSTPGCRRSCAGRTPASPTPPPSNT